MKCVVTGGCGFIGSHVVSELVSRGYDIVVYDNVRKSFIDELPGVTFVYGDIRNYQLLVEVFRDTDFVFHLSGVLGTNELFDMPREAIDVNICGALNVLLASRETQVNRIFFPAKPNEWNNVYSVTAQAVEKLGHAYRENMDMDVRVLRLWNVYGQRQKFFPVRKAVPLFISQALRNFPVEVFGDGKQILELLYVEDVVKVIVDYLLLDYVVLNTYELRSTHTMNVEELARQIIAMAGSLSDIVFLPMRKGEDQGVKFIRAKDVQELLGDLTFTSFDVGLKKTIEWYRLKSVE